MKWPPPHRPLEGAIVRLEPIDADRRERLAEVARESQTWTWIHRRIAVERAAFDAWFEAPLAATRDRDELCFVTCRATSGEPAGSSSYLNVRPEHDGVEIGRTWLHPAAWRTGANLEAKLFMLGRAFHELGCMRVEFKTDARNERSRIALGALPATFEEILRRHMRVPDTGVRDSAYLSIVDNEWPAVRANLITRLAPRAEASAGA